MAKYFYNPRLERDDDGEYVVSIWKRRWGKTKFVNYLHYPDPVTLLGVARMTVNFLNK